MNDPDYVLSRPDGIGDALSKGLWAHNSFTTGRYNTAHWNTFEFVLIGGRQELREPRREAFVGPVDACRASDRRRRVSASGNPA